MNKKKETLNIIKFFRKTESRILGSFLRLLKSLPTITGSSIFPTPTMAAGTLIPDHLE